MGKIKDSLKALTYYLNNNAGLADQLKYIGELIESELQKISATVGKELREQDKGIGDIAQGTANMFKMLKQRTKRIEALEERLPSVIQKDIATDKYEPKFRVGDTIAFIDDGAMRIVLEIDPDNLMRLMNVPTGHIQTGRIQTRCPASWYRLVYRPKPKEG